MKKFLSLLMFVLFSVTMNATITNVQAEVLETNATIYWQADTALSTYYDVALVDGTTYGFFCEGTWPKEAFIVEGANYLAMTSDLLLNYGMNYTDLDPNDSIEAQLIPSWQTGWQTNVDTVDNYFTLRPGDYLFTVTGYDANFTPTESMAYTFFTIEDKSQDVISVHVNENAVKEFDMITKQLYIRKGNQKYNLIGNKIQ